jgi:hypothetical protein
MWPWNRTAVIALSALGSLASATRLPETRKCVLFPSGITRTQQKKRATNNTVGGRKNRRKWRPDRPQASCSWLATLFWPFNLPLAFSFNTYERRESVQRRTDVKICVVGSKRAIFGPTQNKFKRLGFPPLRPIRPAAPIRPALASSPVAGEKMMAEPNSLPWINDTGICLPNSGIQARTPRHCCCCLLMKDNTRGGLERSVS